MIQIISTIFVVIILFILGNFIPALKKLTKLITNSLLKILNFFGIKIKKKEHNVYMSEEFKHTYKDIKAVKLSNKNLRQTSSIDWVAFSILVIAGTLFLVNFFTHWVISTWIYGLIKWIKIIKSPSDMNTIFIATMFSCMSFALSKLLQRWKETKQERIEKKQLKLKQKALALMDSKELLENAKKKDSENYERLKK